MSRKELCGAPGTLSNQRNKENNVVSTLMQGHAVSQSNHFKSPKETRSIDARFGERRLFHSSEKRWI